MATSVITQRDPNLQQLSVSFSGIFSTARVEAFKYGKVIMLGGYFSNTTEASGIVATITNAYPVNGISNWSTPCQSDDGSVTFITFSKSGNDLNLICPRNLTASKVCRFTCSLPSTL